MRIIAQRQAKMTKVLRRVIGLLHGAQGRDIDQLGIICPRRAIQQSIEMFGL